MHTFHDEYVLFIIKSFSSITAKLRDLRNKWLVAFTLSNTIWLVLLAILANKGHMLRVVGSDPLGT